jgi:membrane protein DedA with SNARE-associated domain
MESFITSSGYAAIFLLMLAESACIPIPSEVTMLVAGVLAAEGKLSLAAVIIVGTLGNVAGSYIAWGVGRTGGRAVLGKFGRLILIRDEDLDRAERWFARRGELAVFVGRLVPVVRTFISLPAGVAEMPAGRFGLYTVLGCLPWTAALASLGYAVGSSWHSIYRGFKGVTYVVVAVAVVAIALFYIRRIRQRRAAQRLAASSTSAPSDGGSRLS